MGFTWETSQPRPTQRASGGRTVGSTVQNAGLGAADMLTFGWGDELAGLIDEDWKYAWRDASRQAEEADPLAYYGGQVAAGFIPGAGLLSLANKAGKAAPLVGGAFRAGNRALTSAGLGLGGRIAAGSVLGGGSAAIAGAGFANDGNRIEGAINAAPVGFAAGIAAPVFAKALGGLGRRAQPPIRTGPVIEGATPMGGIADTPVSEGALDDFIRTAQRGPRRTADDLEAYVNQGLADPGRGRTFMDALGRAGTKKMRSLYSQPGQAADLAEQALVERARGARDRLERGVSGIDSGDPLEGLKGQVDEIAKAELSPALSRPTVGNAKVALENLSRRPTVKNALGAADDQIEEHIAAGILPESARGDPAYRLHYAKIVLQAGAKDPTRLPSGLRTMSNANLVSASNAIIDTLDQLKPGYRSALASLQSRMQPMSAVKALRQAQRTDRSNVAGNALGMPAVRQSIDNGMDGFGQALRTEDELFRNSSRVLTGSDTASNVSELLSQGVAANQPPSVVSAVQGAWRATFGQIGKELFGDMAEQRSNELVRMMLQRVDDPDPAVRAKVREFLTRVRERMTQLEAMSRNSARQSVEFGSGVAGNQVQEF